MSLTSIWDFALSCWTKDYTLEFPLGHVDLIAGTILCIIILLVTFLVMGFIGLVTNLTIGRVLLFLFAGSL